MNDTTVRIRNARSEAAEALEKGMITPAVYVQRTLEEVREELSSTPPAVRPPLAPEDPVAK
jgi:hypothetical protein